MVDQPVLLGIERPRKPRSWINGTRTFFSNPAVAAAIGSFIAFFATQAAEYWKAGRAESSELMLAELADGREFVSKIPDPKTSEEAAGVIKVLERQVAIMTTEQARTLMQNSIAVFDTMRSRLELAEQAAQVAKEEAERAAAIAAQQAATQAEIAAAEAAARAAAEAERVRQEQLKMFRDIGKSTIGIGGLRF